MSDLLLVGGIEVEESGRKTLKVKKKALGALFMAN